MSSLGKCFGFCVEYEREMKQFYWDKNPTTVTHEADAETLRMVQVVGDRCRLEVREFLDKCWGIINAHFETIGKCSTAKRSETNWHIRAGVWLNGTRQKRGNWRMEAGVKICRDSREVIPWIWATGKEEAEQKMMDEFGKAAIRSAELNLQRGTVALARIPILLPGANNFEVDADDLEDKVRQAFAPITKSRFENVYNYVKNK